MQKQTGVRFTFIPYRGSAPAMQDLLSEQIDIYIGLPADLLPQARAGNVKDSRGRRQGANDDGNGYSDRG